MFLKEHLVREYNYLQRDRFNSCNGHAIRYLHLKFHTSFLTTTNKNTKLLPYFWEASMFQM